MENNIDILIIEDEALIAETIKMQLADFGYGIAGVYYRYETALTAIEKTNYDLIITDINLGHGTNEKSGITLMNHVKKIKKCPFIFLTALSDKDTLKQAALLHPSAYLVKPINAANLYAAIQLAVENYQNTTPANTDNLEKETKPDYFFVKSGNKLVKVFWNDVYVMESVKNYVRIKSAGYNSDLLVRASLHQFLKINMPAAYRKLFIKISRSTAIAKNIILALNETTIETRFGIFERTAGINEEEL